MSLRRRGSGGGAPGSPKEEAIEVEGLVVQALGAGRYRVRIDGTEQEPICKAAGKLSRFRIKITQGDRVRVELSPYDLTRGRITYRL